MPLPSPTWGEVILTAVGSGGLVKAADLLFGRKGREVKALGDTITALSDQLEKSDARQDRFGARLGDVERDLVECHENHEKCEAGREVDRREIAALKAQIDRLMDGPVAPYRPGDMQRPVPPKRRPKG